MLSLFDESLSYVSESLPIYPLEASSNEEFQGARVHFFPPQLSRFPRFDRPAKLENNIKLRPRYKYLGNLYLGPVLGLLNLRQKNISGCLLYGHTISSFV